MGPCHSDAACRRHPAAGMRDHPAAGMRDHPAASGATHGGVRGVPCLSRGMVTRMICLGLLYGTPETIEANVPGRKQLVPLAILGGPICVLSFVRLFQICAPRSYRGAARRGKIGGDPGRDREKRADKLVVPPSQTEDGSSVASTHELSAMRRRQRRIQPRMARIGFATLGRDSRRLETGSNTLQNQPDRPSRTAISYPWDR